MYIPISELYIVVIRLLFFQLESLNKNHILETIRVFIKPKNFHLTSVQCHFIRSFTASVYVSLKLLNHVDKSHNKSKFNSKKCCQWQYKGYITINRLQCKFIAT